MNFMCLTSPEVCEHCLNDLIYSSLSICLGWYKCSVGRPLLIKYRFGSSINSLGIAFAMTGANFKSRFEMWDHLFLSKSQEGL